MVDRIFLKISLAAEPSVSQSLRIMNEQPPVSPTKDEARAALTEIDLVMARTRTAIARGPSAPLLILWGCIWSIADLTTQYHPQALQWLWWALDLIGFASTCWIIRNHRARVKSPGGWRYGVFWGAILFYAILWLNLLVPVKWPQTPQQWVEFEPIFRRVTAYFHTIPMFAYVIGGLFVGRRYFIWIGLLVTALILAGYCWAGAYFYLWLAVTGGGSLLFSGIIIRKFWR